MRLIAYAAAAVAVALPALAQQRRAPADPIELSGPPKRPPVITPAMKAFADSGLSKVDLKDPKAVAGFVRQLTAVIDRFPSEADLYSFRATMLCESSGARESILSDVTMALKLRPTSASFLSYSERNDLTVRSKVEFDLGRYENALNDVDAAIRFEYDSAEHVFNGGNVKPNEPTTSPCTWTMSDLNKLAQLFPTDYRPPLYLGLYLTQFSDYSLDFDFQPVFKAFAHAAELNPSSALPAYYTGIPYIAGGIGGVLSRASSTCIGDIEPRTKDCLALDDLHREGIRWLTKAIAADSTFEPAYELRATTLYELKQSGQAIRDFNKTVELNPKANIYNDRALAKTDLHDYDGAILDYTKAIAHGCRELCRTYENRANAYLAIHDYLHAVNDIGHQIAIVLDGIVSGFNIDQFRRIYPEYDDVADEVLCEKLRILFMPEMDNATFSKHFLFEAKPFDDFILPELYLKRGDAYADMGDMSKANREYDRASNGFPTWAAQSNSFSTQNGKRVRIRG